VAKVIKNVAADSENLTFSFVSAIGFTKKNKYNSLKL
jgi:hypothetical protein